jgi:hypothetical protein
VNVVFFLDRKRPLQLTRLVLYGQDFVLVHKFLKFVFKYKELAFVTGCGSFSGGGVLAGGLLGPDEIVHHHKSC